MKTHTFLNILKLAFLATAIATQVGCGKNSSSGSSSSYYYMSNGYCYAGSSGQVVNNSYCTSNNGYTLGSDGYCRQTSTNQVVSNTYCTNTSGYQLINGSCYNSSGVVVGASYCNGTGGAYTCTAGTYFYYTGWGYQPIQCTPTTCRGAWLYTQNGALVYCQ